MHEADIYKNFTDAQLWQNIPFRFWQSNILISSSVQKITDHHAEPQEHISYRHNKSDLPK